MPRRRVLVGILAGCGTLSVLGVLLAVALVTVGVVGAGSEDEEGTALIRLSGTEGLPFEGFVSTHERGNQTETTRRQDVRGKIGAAPTEYEVPVTLSYVDGQNSLYAIFTTPGSAEGKLEVELFVDGRFVDAEETSEERITVEGDYYASVHWCHACP